VTGWLTDTIRLGWGALYWNTRKTWHSLRGRRRRCPCQVASDSGRAHETGCEAVLHFRSPGRFRAVCPLLARRADGAWVCSVDAAHVRPFWGRAALLLLGGAIATFLLLTLAAFALLRSIGYDLTYRQAVWPPAWREFRSVQSRYYIEQARHARETGHPQQAILALSNAYELNPSDYATGLVLAQLWQAGQPLLSDGTFARLLREHPIHREQTARLWYRALLARGDFASIQLLAGERLLHPESPTSAPAPAWAQAFLFAHRRTADHAALDRLLSADTFPSSLRGLFLLEKSLFTQGTSERVASLSAAAAAESNPFALFHLLRRLLEENRPDLVLPFTLAAQSPLSDREKIRLRLDALAALDRPGPRAELASQLLARPTHPALTELLGAHLIAHPDLPLARALAEKLARDPLPPGEATYPQLLAWFAVCGAHRDPELLRSAASLLSTAAARDIRAISFAQEAFLAPGDGFRLETVLPLLQPLPLETIYALYQRFSPPPP
jgi:hypothetical protein